MQHKLICLCFIALFTACAHHNTQILDVKSYVEKRANCEHLLGEISGEPSKDPDREKEVSAGIEKYCTGVDEELARLKIRHKNDSEILEKLNQFEVSIEK